VIGRELRDIHGLAADLLVDRFEPDLRLERGILRAFGARPAAQARADEIGGQFVAAVGLHQPR
jgi:hypothetical protein